MPQFYLSTHVYSCVTKEGVIFLDLKQDEYTGLGRAEAGALGTLVHGWPMCERAPAERALAPEFDPLSLAMQMKERGLLTEDRAAGKIAAPTALQRAQAALDHDDLERPPAIRFVDVANFIIAYIVAALGLRWLSLERMARRVGRRRMENGTSSIDVRRARELVGIFYRLRPFAYTARDQCLFDSLVMVEYLSRYRLYPQWVFGVTTGPFAAHSWVQGDGVVFNATLERAREFTPILAI